MNMAMAKSTPQERHRDILKCDPHLDADDFPLVLCSPTEVDGISNEANVVKFRLRPRTSCDGDAADADEGAFESPLPKPLAVVHPSTDDEDVALGKCESPLPNALLDVASLRRYRLRTPPPRLALKPRLQPRGLRPRIRGDDNPSSSGGTAPAAFPYLDLVGASGADAPGRLCLSEITSGIPMQR